MKLLVYILLSVCLCNRSGCGVGVGGVGPGLDIQPFTATSKPQLGLQAGEQKA